MVVLLIKKSMKLILKELSLCIILFIVFVCTLTMINTPTNKIMKSDDF